MAKRCTLVSLAVVTMASMITINGAQGAPKISVESPLAWLRITPGTDPAFTAKVNAVLGSDALAMIADVLPYSVVVSNTGSEPLAGIGLRFALRIKDSVVTRDFFYHSFGEPQRPVLPAGQSRVFTPLKTANMIAAKATVHGGSGGFSGPRPGQSEPSVVQLLSTAEEIRISVELAVAQDGRAAGPDRPLTVMRYKQDLETYTSMRDECLARLAHGDSAESIEAWLAPLSTQKVYSGPAGWAVSMRMHLAKEWLGTLKASGRAGLQSELSTWTPDMSFPDIRALRLGGLQ
jgi:hypothetical protein